MTAEATPARSARKPAPVRVPCPEAGCGYTMDSSGSIPAHVAMAHPEVPMDAIAPRRRVAAAGELPAPEHGPDCPTGFHAHVFTPADSSTAPASTPPLAGAAPASAVPTELDIDEIVVEDNVREDLGDLEALVASIREHGLLQALLIDRVDVVGPVWRLVDGHRRLEAARQAGLRRVPVQVAPRAFDAGERTTVQIVANTHRRDLGPLEEARGYRAIMARDGITQAELARRLSKDPSTIANALRLLEAAPETQALLVAGSISASHVKAVLGLPPKAQAELAQRAAEGSWSAHSTEVYAAQERERIERDGRMREQSERATRHALKALAGTPGDAVVVVTSSYLVADRTVLAAIIEAGWPNARSGWWPAGAGKVAPACGCTTLGLELGDGSGAHLGPVCTVLEHQPLNEKETKRAEAEQVRELERQQLRSALETALARVSPTLVRLLVRHLEAYGQGTTWTAYGKLDNAEVVRSLAARMANVNGAVAIPVEKVIATLVAEASA